MKYDIFMAVAPKDLNKLPYVLDSIYRNVTGFDKVYICSPYRIENARYDIVSLLDEEVLDFDSSKFNYRPKWVYQQFLKMFQDVTPNDYFMTIDADTIINKPMEMFQDDKPIWRVGWGQDNPPYYEFNQKMLGFRRTRPHTFLADMNFFYKPFIKEMLDFVGLSKKGFLERTSEIVTDTCYPSEADLYGNFVFKSHADHYVLKGLKTHCQGKSSKYDQMIWTDQEIKARIHSMENVDVDTFSIHSWTKGE